MATLNRFNKFTDRDFSWKTYIPEIATPNFELWDQTLNRLQTGYDQALSIRNKLPAYLPWREDLAAQYKEQANKGVDAITEAYTKQGVNAGNRALRDFGQTINNEWQPGGLASELQNEYNDYQAAQTKIDQYYKDQKAENSANREYSLSLLNNAAKGKLERNPVTGMYTRPQLNPSLFPYVDIADEALKVVKEIKGSGTSSIVALSPAWFEKIQTEDKVTPETIKAVTDALLQQPKYKQQMAIETIQAKSKYTPEELAKLEEDTKANISNQVDKTLSSVDKLASSTKTDDKKDLQTQLQNAGYYDGKIDGDFDAKSKEALAKYKEDIQTAKEQKLQNVNADNLIQNSIKQNYAQPLISAFARETVKKDLIYNKQYDLNVRMANQRKSSQDLITAVQSLKDPATSNFIVSPGLSKPMETFDKIKTNYQNSYNESKKVFDQTVQWSGLSGILGTSAPNAIHEMTQARMRSGSFDEFKKNAAGLGVTNETDLQNVWNFYNGPGSDQLRTSYIAMQDAKTQVDNAANAEQAMTTAFTKSPEGKKQLDKIRKSYGLTNVSDEDIVNQILNDKNKFSRKGYEKDKDVEAGTKKGVADPFGETFTKAAGTAIGTFIGGPLMFDKVKEKFYGKNDAEEFLSARDNYVNKNKVEFPLSLRGYAINAVAGEGANLEKVIIDDITSGNSIGYTGDDKPLVFTSVDGKTKYNDNEVDLKGAKLRFNVDASGITYYINGKSADGKANISAIAKAPPEHYDRLRIMALQMKKEAAQTGDRSLDAQANALYARTTKGAGFENAVEDAMVITDKNGRRLYDVVDPQRSTKGSIQTFGNNSRIKGTPVGQEWESSGNIYQKFKVKDNDGKQAYMMTMKTNAGFVPLPNDSGGMYFSTAQEAEAPVWTAEMIRQLPSEVNQTKIKQTNLTNDQAASLMLGAQPIIQEYSNDNQDDNNDN